VARRPTQESASVRKRCESTARSQAEAQPRRREAGQASEAKDAWVVEPACEDDAPSLAALARALLPATGAPSGPVWVVREAGALAGYLEARRAADELHVLALAVAPRARRQGAASALLQAVLGEAAREGVARVHLEVRASNTAARRFYERHGFALVGRRRRYYRNDEDALLLTRELAPAAAAAS